MTHQHVNVLTTGSHNVASGHNNGCQLLFRLKDLIVKCYAHHILTHPGGAAPPKTISVRCKCFIVENEVVKL